MPNVRKFRTAIGKGARRVYRGALRVKRAHDAFKRKHPVVYSAGVKALHYGARAYWPARFAYAATR